MTKSLPPKDQRTAERHHRHTAISACATRSSSIPPARHEWERPEILVEISGADSPLVLENGAELLRAFEHVALEMLRLAPDEHEKVQLRLPEFPLRSPAGAAPGRRCRRRAGAQDRHALCLRAHVVARAPHRSSGIARSRRPAHRKRRRSAAKRHVVVYPKDYNGKPPAPAVSRRR